MSVHVRARLYRYPSQMCSTDADSIDCAKPSTPSAAGDSTDKRRVLQVLGSVCSSFITHVQELLVVLENHAGMFSVVLVPRHMPAVFNIARAAAAVITDFSSAVVCEVYAHVARFSWRKCVCI